MIKLVETMISYNMRSYGREWLVGSDPAKRAEITSKHDLFLWMNAKSARKTFQIGTPIAVICFNSLMHYFAKGVF